MSADNALILLKDEKGAYSLHDVCVSVLEDFVVFPQKDWEKEIGYGSERDYILSCSCLGKDKNFIRLLNLAKDYMKEEEVEYGIRFCWLNENFPDYYKAVSKIKRILNSSEFENDEERMEKIKKILDKLEK